MKQRQHRAGPDSPGGPRTREFRLTGQQISQRSDDVVCAEVRLLLAAGFDIIVIRGVRSPRPAGAPGPSRPADQASAAGDWYAASAEVYRAPDAHQPAAQRPA